MHTGIFINYAAKILAIGMIVASAVSCRISKELANVAAAGVVDTVMVTSMVETASRLRDSLSVEIDEWYFYLASTSNVDSTVVPEARLHRRIVIGGRRDMVACRRDSVANDENLSVTRKTISESCMEADVAHGGHVYRIVVAVVVISVLMIVVFKLKHD